ncbi:ribonuclease toxin immunity protein CdiI [Lachnobacterium bovis]|uniref:ribonuclease toxin immunity protein CdiI n=1 Tax=Lachnobacterium bovis TaxID=140626 RepID=UPI000684E5E0|nr:ribonuclease toxin immunity protein CdiI [Lachnobacterium bovis]
MSIEKNNKVTIVTDDNLGECYSEFYEYYWKKKCNKGAVNDTFNEYVNSNCFLEVLDDMKNKLSDYNQSYGMIFSDDYDDPYDEFYFGENVIQFFSGPDYDYHIDIIGYEEFYKYLVSACEFYVERRHPEHKEIVEQKLKEIREAYGLKKHNFWQNICKLF